MHLQVCLAAFAWLLAHLTSLFVDMAPAGALAAEQSYPPPPPDASPQPGASAVLLAALEQEPSVDTLQPKDKSAESEVEAASGVALQTNPAGPAEESPGSPPLRPYRRAGFTGGSTPRLLKPVGVLMHAPPQVPPLIMPFPMLRAATFHLVVIVVY